MLGRHGVSDSELDLDFATDGPSALHQGPGVVKGAGALQRLELDGGRPHQGVTPKETPFGPNFNFGALPLENALTSLEKKIIQLSNL